MSGRRSSEGLTKAWVDGIVPMDGSHRLEFEAQALWKRHLDKGHHS